MDIVDVFIEFLHELAREKMGSDNPSSLEVFTHTEETARKIVSVIPLRSADEYATFLTAVEMGFLFARFLPTKVSLN